MDRIANATTEIEGDEVTPEMVRAGVAELVRYYPEDNDDQDAEDRRAVTEIYRAMSSEFSGSGRYNICSCD